MLQVLQHIPILRKKTKYYAEYSACLTEAVLLNSKTIVELLIQKNFVVNVCFKNLSALRWATIFQFNEIKQLLQESGASSFLEDETINMCVFNSVLNINQRNDHLIRRLLQLGQAIRRAISPFLKNVELLVHMYSSKENLTSQLKLTFALTNTCISNLQFSTVCLMRKYFHV
jgi:hypothetical protein